MASSIIFLSFVRFADVATGNSFIDGTNGFVQSLVVCCGEDTTFTGSDFLFCIVFGIEFLAVGFGCLVLTFIGSSMVVVCGVDAVTPVVPTLKKDETTDFTVTTK